MSRTEQIQVYVRQRYGFVPRTCWIAHVKELCGLKVRIAHNREDPNKRKDPCPENNIEPIKEGLRHVGLVQ